MSIGCKSEGRRRVILSGWLALGFGATVRAAAPAAGPVGIVTVAEGEARLIRGSAVYALAPGLRLLPADLVHTSGAQALVRIEQSDGRMLELGPDARAWVAPRFLAGAAWYVQKGWFKFATARKDADRLVTPLAEVQLGTGVVMGQVGADEVSVFAEAGAPKLVSRSPKVKLPATLPRAGDHVTLKTDAQAPEVLSRPPGPWLAAMPKAFRDTLPALAARYPDAPALPKPLAEIDYALVAPWLQGEPLLRRAALERWRRLADQREFRAALKANLALHPEWDPVLNPPPPRRR